MNGVSSFYGDFQALYDVSIDVAEGETVAIVGANGAGKSTLLRTVAGIVQTRAGHITYDGTAIDGMRPHQRARLGSALVPEGRRVFASLTVEENLRVGANTRRSGPWTIPAVFELFPHLQPIARRSAALLSGGEQQALAIGRALMSSPRLLLLDEVSLGLAPIVIRLLYEVIPRIAAAGTSIVIVQQNIDQALAVSSRVYCLLKGRIALEGRPADISRAQITSVYFGV